MKNFRLICKRCGNFARIKIRITGSWFDFDIQQTFNGIKFDKLVLECKNEYCKAQEELA